MIFPEKFIAGETVMFPSSTCNLSLSDYPASEWTMTIVAVGPSKLTYTATASGSDYVIAINTNSLTAGTYTYQTKVVKGSVTKFLSEYSGTFEVAAALSGQNAGYDSRSHAMKMLAAIEAVLENRATHEHKSIEHNGRKLYKHSFAELAEIRDYYRGELARANIRKRGTFKTVNVRF